MLQRIDTLRLSRFLSSACGMQNKDDPDQMQIHHSNWQVSIMSAEKHREYTYNVLDFVHPDGRPYQTQKRVVRGEPGGPLEPVEKNITLKVVDYSDKVRNPLLVMCITGEAPLSQHMFVIECWFALQRAEATFMYKERHFLGGCLHGQETIKSGVAHLKNEAVCVWWPGERCGVSPHHAHGVLLQSPSNDVDSHTTSACRSWFKGRVAGTISKARQFDIEYDDGEIWNNKGFTTMVWRLVWLHHHAQCFSVSILSIHLSSAVLKNPQVALQCVWLQAIKYTCRCRRPPRTT